MWYKILLIILFICINIWSGALPDPKKTPGDVIPGVMLNWVCNKYIDSEPITMKSIIVVYRNYGINLENNNYIINKLIPSSLGGSSNVKNLWPIRYMDLPYKIKVENDLFRCVCNGLMPLKEAQSILMVNWKAWNIDSLK